MERPRSLLLLPPRQLSSCIAAAIFRDTRGAQLSDADRFNYFPASPLVAVTHVIDGELRLVGETGCLDTAQRAQAMARQTAVSPQDDPVVSWSPGPVAAVTVGFYPDAWMKLSYELGCADVPEAVAAAMSVFDGDVDAEIRWDGFCEAFSPVWQYARSTSGVPDWPGSDRIRDWSVYALNRLALTGFGRSIRTAERRLKRWTGQSRRSLEFYANIEDLHRRTVKRPDLSLVAHAHDAGFSDQSHMGRAVRRATGFSPARLNHLIKAEESFWCYRLLQERY